MNEQDILHSLMGAGAGGGLILIFFKRIVKNLEDSTQKIHDVFIKLSAISVRLEILDHHHASLNKLNEIVHSHAQSIAVLNSKVENGKK